MDSYGYCTSQNDQRKNVIILVTFKLKFIIIKL